MGWRCTVCTCVRAVAMWRVVLCLIAADSRSARSVDREMWDELIDGRS